MRRISSSLLVLIACSAIAEAADQPATQNAGRAVRLEEGRQKGLTSQTAATGREVSGLIDEYRYNGIGDEGKLKVLDKLQKELVRLTDANLANVKAGEDSTTMPWVTTRLNAARQLQNLVELRKELMAASEGQDHVIVQIDKLLKQMQEQFGKQLKTDLSEVIQEQQRLKDATEQLAEKTLGEKTEKLTQEQKQDLEKTSEQQQALEEQVKEAVKELQEQAKDQSQPEQAKNAQEALEKLQDPKVQDAIEQASQDIQDNQLAQAQEQQQQVLDALKQAQQELAKNDASDASQPQDQQQSAAQLEQQLQQVENLAQQQQQLLDQTQALDQQSSPQEFNKLQAQQASLQNQLQQLQPQGEAAEAAKEAQEAMAEAAQELGQQDKGEAAEAQQEALAALNELKSELAEQLAAATGAPQPKPPMPGQGPEQPMPPQLVVQNQSQVKDPKEAKELGADLQDGEKKEPAGPAAWQVGLPPKEREALNAAQKDKFPSRYERQLALYYQNLAAGQQ